MASAAMQLTRGALMAMSAGAGSMYVYVHGLAPTGLSASELAQAAAARLAAGARGGSGVEQLPAYLKPLADQLGELSGEVARMRVQSQYGSGFVYSQQGWGLSWATVATAGGVGVLFLYMKGYSFADFAYASKAALAAAVETLQSGLADVGAALEAAKRELSYKLGLLEEQVEETRRSLEDKIASEVGDVKRDLDVVGRDVKGISRAQEQVHGMVQSMESQMDAIEHRMGSANEQLSTANRGIYLLCNVVAENMGGAAAGGKGNNGAPQPPRGASLYDELLAYTRSAVGGFASAAQSAQARAQSAGLRMLVADPQAAQAPQQQQLLPPGPSSALDAVPAFREMLSGKSFRLSDRGLDVAGSSSNQQQ